MRCGKDRLAAELAASFIQECHDGLVLLGNQCDEIGLAIAIQVGNGDMRGAMAAVEHLRKEGRLLRISRLVCQKENPARVVPAEFRDHKIDLAIAGEIRGPYIGDAADAIENRDGCELSARLPTKPDHAAHAIVRCMECAEDCQHHIVDAIAIEIDHLGVGTCKPPREHLPGRRPFVWAECKDLVVQGIADENVNLVLVEEVNEIDVRDSRQAGFGKPISLAVEIHAWGSWRRPRQRSELLGARAS